jgi:OOP family OmpA-OmpF porin
MRKLLAHVLSAMMMVGLAGGAGAATIGCSDPPPPATPKAKKAPQPKKKRERKVATPPPSNFDMVGEMIKLPAPVMFETGSDRLKPESDVVLELVADYLDAKQQVTTLRIEGHTDADGDDRANQTLSEKRAMAVAHWLTDRGGVDCRRLIPVGFGESQPVAPNNTPEGKTLNRRVAFVNAAVNDRALGGKPLDGGGRVAGDPCQ